MFTLPLTLTGLLITLAIYILYHRFLHPLSSFPGPFLASFTNLWRFYHELRGDLPSVLHTYHVRYGSFIRVSPSEIDTDMAEVIDVVYKRGGRHYLKSDFYDGFTAIRPNIFGTRDEDHHALRRRQMAHAFSQASLVKMEYIFDRHVRNLINKLDQRAKSGESFHLENALRFYSQDANGDLSLGVQFGTQDADDPALLPPLNDHIALAKLTGYVPGLKPFLDRYGGMIPWPYLQKLLRSRAWMRQEASRVTDIEFHRAGRSTTSGQDVGLTAEDSEPGRINLFTSLVRARDPSTGDFIDRNDITSNAITFLTAGSHSTAATVEIFFWYLLYYPDVMGRVSSELNDTFGTADDSILPFSGLEAQLPYLSAVFSECFRLSPTFQHPAPRVAPNDTSNPRFPTVIAGMRIPPGYAVSASLLSLHRNKAIWGADADEFTPERWFDKETWENERLLMHFGAGHRACIGRNQSLIMLWKAVVEVVRRFEFELVGEREQQQKQIELKVCGFAELARPLEVRVRRRQVSLRNCAEQSGEL